VGLLPPLPDRGALLVDGGYTNNFPLEHLPERGAGTIIRVDVSGVFEDSEVRYGDALSGTAEFLWRLWTMVTPCVRRKKRLSPPNLQDIQSRLMFLADYNKESFNDEMADLTLRPPVKGYSIIEFDKFDELVDIGFQYGQEQIRNWKATPEGQAVMKSTRAKWFMAPPQTLRQKMASDARARLEKVTQAAGRLGSRVYGRSRSFDAASRNREDSVGACPRRRRRSPHAGEPKPERSQANGTGKPHRE